MPERNSESQNTEFDFAKYRIDRLAPIDLNAWAAIDSASSLGLVTSSLRRGIGNKLSETMYVQRGIEMRLLRKINSC